MDKQYHISVLLEETINAVLQKPGSTYIDVTFGGGGHTQALLEKDPQAKVIGLDWDKNVIERAQEKYIPLYGDRLQLVWGSFTHLYKILKKHRITQVDGILADFGTSQFQIHQTEGLSFWQNTPLDMRLSQAHHRVTAATIVNYATPQELRTIFWKYGEEPHTKEIVNGLVEMRKKKKITTTGQLVALIEKVVPRRSQKIHPATRIFQALRIVVNKELDNIAAFLPAALQALQPGGRLACISFHSLEDRLVKDFFKDAERTLKGTIIKPFPIKPSAQEIEHNSSARSSRLRIFEKIS